MTEVSSDCLAAYPQPTSLPCAMDKAAFITAFDRAATFCCEVALSVKPRAAPLPQRQLVKVDAVAEQQLVLGRDEAA